MRNYTEGIQKSIRQMNLIPNTQEYKWWYTIKHINSENIQEALNQSLGKENVVALLNKAQYSTFKNLARVTALPSAEQP